MLADEGQGVSEQIERDGETAARRTHHRFMMLERVAMLVEDRHMILGPEPGRYFLGLDGRSSTRLWVLRGSDVSRLITTSATSSDEVFQSAPLVSSPEKPVATEPG